MKLQQLELLAAVVDHGGIRAAARGLQLSQAAVTKALRQLEQEAGVPLLVRKPRGVLLTDAGARLLARARAIARQVELARDELRQAAGQAQGSVRVGVTPFVCFGALGPAFRWFRQRWPAVQVQVIEGLMARVLPRLRDGTLDLALVAADPGELDDGEFQCRRVARVSQVPVVRQGHPVLAGPSAAALAALEWLLTHPVAGAVPSRVDAMFAQAGVAPPARVLLCETLAAMALLRHSDAVSLFPRPLLGHPESRGIVPVPGAALQPHDLELVLLTPRGLPLTPAAEYFAHCLETECRGSG